MQVADLLEANEALAGKLARLEHLLSRNSSNSSMPPSKDDDPGKTPPAEKPKPCAGGGPNRRRGKQPDASGANLAWVKRPDGQVDRFPQGRCACGHDLAGARDLGVVDRYQQHEIPQISVRITQYDQHQVRCGCGRLHTAARPEGAPPRDRGVWARTCRLSLRTSWSCTSCPRSGVSSCWSR
jgi:transposase